MNLEENWGLLSRQDDYLDAFGDKNKTGNKRAGDILAIKNILLSMRWNRYS
jgi:geranylgeranyl pyrophosphate synthase